MINLSAPLSALNAFSQGMNTMAHNVANVNTNNFRAGRTTFQESPTKVGVEAQSTFPQKPSPINDDEIPLNNNVDYAREAVNSITYQRGFEANVVSIQTADSMLGTAIDMKI